MSTMTVCDRCGRIILDDDHAHEFAIVLGQDVRVIGAEVCDKCHESLLGYYARSITTKNSRFDLATQGFLAGVEIVPDDEPNTEFRP